MPLSEMVIRSKLIPPQPHQAYYRRTRLTGKLFESHHYPLTVIHAGTGFGKTTALIELCSSFRRVYWYDITAPDRDPALFLAHLVAAFSPGTDYLLERLNQGGLSATGAVLNGLLNHLTTDLEDDAVLVLDDFHLVSDVPEINRWIEQLVEQHPPCLHLACSFRQIPNSPAFIRWRVKGSVLMISQVDLSFSQDEILSLFSDHHRFPITATQAQTLYGYTDGWIIALQMVWQRLADSQTRNLDHLLAELPAALPEIFNFLAHEVLMRQPVPLQEFLVASSILRQMDAPACDALLGTSGSQEVLQQIYDKGLFVITVDQAQYRYQRLFQDFLQARAGASPDTAKRLHRRAAEYYLAGGEPEEAIYHQLTAGESDSAARLIATIGPILLKTGRPGTLVKWLEQVNPQDLEKMPALYLMQGDALRLSSNFEEAISAYKRAEGMYTANKDPLGRSQALCSQAKVYLDTIRPLKAASLLEEAMALLEPQEHPAEVSEMLDLLAENKLNLGKPEEARTLHQEATMLRSEAGPDDIYLESRSLLRTGRLHEARDLIESSGALTEDPARRRAQRFHREMPVLLSLICSMLGDAGGAEMYAAQGIETGRQLGAPFVEAVGLMRLGHACQLRAHSPWHTKRLEKARACYERAIELVRPFNVVRVQVEPLWGLCRLFGYQGSLTEANRCARQAIEVAGTSGDYWFVALIRTTMGTSYCLAGEHSLAAEWLDLAQEGFEQVGDCFGKAAAGCACMLNSWLAGRTADALQTLTTLAPTLQQNNLGFLLTQPSHLGLQDTQPFLPLLFEAQQQGVEVDFANRVLRELNLASTGGHPGCGLNVRCLGPFEVWRGREYIHLHEWQREKARQLFQFFIIRRGKWFSRDQIIEYLWPGSDPESAGQNLKVALNALNHALEPRRPSGQRPFFLLRRENQYGLNPAAQIRVDLDDFECLAVSGQEEDLLEALAIYRDDYLPEYTDDHQAAVIRDRAREQYTSAGLRLVELYLLAGNWDPAVKVSHEILARDNCNEAAYQLLMRSQAGRGNRPAVNSVYQRCCKALREELDISPSPETTRLWEQLCA